ncbi:hypothetical protein CSC73_04415 [Pseudoxanthomonas sacheonensis]|nr:hypothetical protein CSC73_04415 [Pseudoxanthomonas sacheonensis]
MRCLDLEFERLWSTMSRCAHRALEAPGLQTRDEMLDRINAVSSCGLLYSRNVMDILTTPAHEPKVFDVCALVREWAYKTNEILLNILDLSCLVPPHPVDIFFDMKAMRLILLTLATYALRSCETAGWSMIGVRSAPRDYGGNLTGTDHVDIMFLCRPGNPDSSKAGSFDKQFAAIKSLAKPFAGVAETWTLPAVGTNVRIRLPVAAPGAAFGFDAPYPFSSRNAD